MDLFDDQLNVVNQQIADVTADYHGPYRTAVLAALATQQSAIAAAQAAYLARIQALTGGGVTVGVAQVKVINDTTPRTTAFTLPTFVDSGLQAIFDHPLQSTASKVLIQANLYVGVDAFGTVCFKLYRNGVDITPAGLGLLAAVTIDTASTIATISFAFEDAPASTTPATYHVYWCVTGNVGINGTMNDPGISPNFIGMSTLSLTELP
jgi:hypothetical protein